MENKNINRRLFVKSTTISTGALLTVPFSLEAMANSSNNRKIKLALIGCGGRGTGAAVQALRADADVELVAMADAFSDQLENSLKAISEELNGERIIRVKEKNRYIGFNAYQKAIDLADVVILTTPPGFRPLHFEYAVNNDKHIFMEKPVATDANGVRKVLKAAKLAENKKLNVVVGLQRRYQKSYNTILDLISNGDIGKIVSGQVYWNGAGVWVRKRKPDQTEMEYQMRNWYYFNWLCGDHILEQHIHNIDVANWFIGEYPKSAQGMGGRQVRKGIDHGEIFDHHFVEFTYPSGAVISSQCRHQPGTKFNVSEAFQGTKGNVFTSGNKNCKITDNNGKDVFRYKSEGDESPYQIEHNKLFQSIRSGGVINNAEYAAKSTLSAIMGRMATYTGKEITWEQALNAKQVLVPDNLNWNSIPPVLPDSNGRYSIPKPGITIIT
ncbi:MAG: Gfo/Idh/MocA family oxidoreductase [Flavobacteriaceae bacterium]|jgi:myo-inositol 2-dehydrogenase/D-chiro-inositol 1-dehydrogenase|nr:Gfo/Idh/MocA family oxidoreductase [Flavobacteriaceae bacterium]MBT3793798.1 Gfo/Idh/MocA family oxidoreductase [Flavobacteriaceae bacterium]MBT4063383.1 Gfo/Idh/MocA family oxidoreductase [Flavobacteriaceae bacterium]MBT6688209.1 Gfo/Idh/MocA family oxidoreductase [Flavobacteriaceae bacterium]